MRLRQQRFRRRGIQPDDAPFMPINLDKKSLPPYLRRKKIVVQGESIREIDAVGDGRKNTIYAVVTSRQRLIVKQAHSRVQQTKERIYLDRKRIVHEMACIGVLAEIVPPDFVPSPVLLDRSNFILVTTAPAREALLWENELLRGRVDLQIAAQCGELLATVHSDTANSRDLRETFKDTKPFEQLRVAPAYGRIGEAFPEYRKVIEDQSKELLKSARVMVLGDLRPRNVWVNKGSIYLIDFATAHFGHPAFDLAFYCRDLCLKAIVNSPQKAAYLEAINVFWLSYFVVARYAGRPKVERSGVRNFGCLLLASALNPPPDMDPPTCDLTRRIAQSLLVTELEKIEDITEFINRTLIDG